MTTAERSYLITTEKAFREQSKKQFKEERATAFEICAELMKQIRTDFEKLGGVTDE